ncbi:MULTISPECIES: hypothetical protein [Mumia]|uniref:SurA N-terminal domain-containing protein n=1 Tax=Mumia xiangluensis TaxID=1678900 RepID=A0ABW1QGJ2_9ACTN|nr:MULTISPECIES: hypothetical protein [Mumia]
MPRRLPIRPLLAAAAASLVLAGCGTVQPGDAVVVGDSRLSMTKLDELADAGCTFLATAAASQGSAVPGQGAVRQVIVTQALQLEGALAVAAREGIEVPEAQWQLPLAQQEQLKEMFSGDDLETAKELLERDYQSLALRAAIGGAEAGEPVTPENTQELTELGSAAVVEELSTLDASVDPRFGVDGVGQPDAGLSLSASSEQLAEVDPSTLPANQQCHGVESSE